MGTEKKKEVKDEPKQDSPTPETPLSESDEPVDDSSNPPGEPPPPPKH